jgi:allantoinase
MYLTRAPNLYICKSATTPTPPPPTAGLQYLLPATWTALSSQGVTFNQLAALLADQPAKLAGLSHCKGRIAVGYDADLVVRAEVTCAHLHGVQA